MKNKLKKLIFPEKKWQSFLYLAFSGVLSGFCMVFSTFFGAAVEWICFIPAALVIYNAIAKNVSLRSAYWIGFWLIYSQHLVVYHWFISFYPLDFTGMTKLAAAGVVVAAVLGLSLIAAIFGGVYVLLTVLISRLQIVKKYPVILPFAAAAGYVLNEWIRTCFWFGVPWGRLALGQLTKGVPISALSASLFGSYFVAFLIVLVSFLLAQSLALGRFKLRPILAISLIAANLICGTVIAALPIDEVESVKVAAVQGNISTSEKWDENTSSYSIFMKYYDLTVQAAKEGAELIVWPETALPSNAFIPDIAEICKEYETYVLFGTFHYDDDGAPSNVLRLIGPQGELSNTIYAKRHLVPFGEYVPMRNLIMTVLPQLADLAMLENDLVPGESSELFDIEINDKKLQLGSLICFDSIFEELSYTSASDGADILCISTNDSWFEDSRAVYMHCEQGRLRAMETGLPTVIAANTGISAIVTQKGEVIDLLEPLVKGYIVQDITVDSNDGNSCEFNKMFLAACASIFVILPIIDLCAYIFKKSK